MQNIIFYVAANETLAAVRDYANAKNATAPTLVRGAACCLKMRLFANSDGTEPYPMEDLSSVVSWSWAMDSDRSRERLTERYFLIQRSQSR